MTATTVQPSPRNGVDVATLFATLDAVKGYPEIARFQFRATNRWISGTHNRSTIDGYYGAKQEMAHRQPMMFDADHPPVLVGTDEGPTPVEFVLHALAACLTAGLANIAAALGVNLTEVSSTVEVGCRLVPLTTIPSSAAAATRWSCSRPAPSARGRRAPPTPGSTRTASRRASTTT